MASFPVSALLTHPLSMHPIKMLSLFSCLFLVIAFSKAQEIQRIQDNLLTVETGKITFRQELKEVDDNLVRYTEVQIDSKGKENETVYNFSFADIDENTVRALTKNDAIFIQLLSNSKQKLIQVLTDGGDKISYVNELQFLASDSENGRQLENLIKGLIPSAIAQDKKRLALTGYNDHMKWLSEHISDVQFPHKQIIQKTKIGAVVGKLVLDQTFNSKNKSNNELRELNFATLNPNSVGYRISGDEFIVTAETRRGLKGIRYVEEGIQKNYTNEVAFYANSIINGKDIYTVLKALIPLAEETFEKNQVDVSSNEKALEFLNGAIAKVTTGEVSLAQSLSIEDNVAQLELTEAEPDKSTTSVYRFNFGDMNANNIDYDGQKNRLFVTLPTKKAVNFIRKTENEELQNYTKELQIHFNTIEDAIVGTKALKSLTTHHETKMESNSYVYSSVPNAIADLKKLMQQVRVDDESFDLFIELIDGNGNMVKVTSIFSNQKKSVETIQEFSLNDINPKNCSIVVKGKHVQVVLNTKHLEKLIKTYVDGDIKPYQYNISIESTGIEEARQMIQIFARLAAKNSGKI